MRGAQPAKPVEARDDSANTIARPAARITFSPPPLQPSSAPPLPNFGKTARLSGAPPLPAPKQPPPPAPVPEASDEPPSWGAGTVAAAANTTRDLDAFSEDSVTKTFADLQERVSQGTAVQTRADSPLLIDVTPLNLLVETVGGYADTLIVANTPVPCDRTRVFITASDHQTTVTIRVAQGSGRRFEENTVLGEVELSGIRSAPRGDVHVAVTFELDADGILNVRAEDKESGRAAKATMRLAGINKEPEHMDEMMSRQSKHTVV